MTQKVATVPAPSAFGKVESVKEVKHADLKQEIKEQFDHTAVGLVHLLFVSINFIAVGAVAAGLGFCLDWACALDADARVDVRRRPCR